MPLSALTTVWVVARLQVSFAAVHGRDSLVDGSIDVLNSESSRLDGSLMSDSLTRGDSLSVGVGVGYTWRSTQNQTVELVRVIQITPQPSPIFSLERAGMSPGMRRDDLL